MSSPRKRRQRARKAAAARLVSPGGLDTGSRRIDVVLPAAKQIDAPPTFNEDGKRPRANPSRLTPSFSSPPRSKSKKRKMYPLSLPFPLSFHLLFPLSLSPHILSPSHRLYDRPSITHFRDLPETEHGRSLFRSPRPFLEAVKPEIDKIEKRWDAIVHYYKLRHEHPHMTVNEAKRQAGLRLGVTPRTITTLLKKQEHGESLGRKCSSTSRFAQLHHFPSHC